MSTLSVLSIKYGVPLLKALYALYHGDAKGVSELPLKILDANMGEWSKSRQARQLVDATRKQILRDLSLFLAKEESGIDIEAVAEEATITFEAGFTIASLIENLDTPEDIPRKWDRLRENPLNRNETDFASYHDLLISSTARALIRILPQMPGFQNWLIAYVSRLRREHREVTESVNRIIGDEKIRDSIYDHDYRASIISHLNHVELFIERSDVEHESRKQVLSVAYVMLTLMRGRTGKEAITDVSADSLLDSLEAGSKGVLVIGPAGCGKTTLLRWAAIEAAQQTQMTNAPEWMPQTRSASKSALNEEE